MFRPSIILLALAVTLGMSAPASIAFAGKKVQIVNGKSGKSVHKQGMRFQRKSATRDRSARFRAPFKRYGTYSGDVRMRFRRNVGTWSAGNVSTIAAPVVEQSTPDVSDVVKLGGQSECQMEAGVCVVRP